MRAYAAYATDGRYKTSAGENEFEMPSCSGYVSPERLVS